MARQKKLLIVEDDHAVRQVLSKEFAKQGIAVFEADNGEKAVEIALQEHPDLILLDVIMPKMHGIEMLRKVKSDEWGKTVPVVILTNYADDPRVVEAVKEGYCDLLSKAESTLDIIMDKVKEKLGIS